MGTNPIFDVAIMTIFAREFLEASIIIGQYRTILMRSPDWEGDRLKMGLKAITNAALIASAIAILVVICVAVPLGVLSRDLDERTAEIIEGVSKIVASICILQLSLKIPKWLGVYASNKMNADGTFVGLSLKSIRFNVAWNIWREVAECGIFLIPFFLGEGATAIPVSALVGIVVALIIGLGIYWGNKKLKKKGLLAFFMAAVLGMLSVGLFTGGCHEFEEVFGETDVVWKIPGYPDTFWSHKKLPMALAKPFGYSAKRTQLQIAAFWSWFAFLIIAHLWKWYSSKKIFEAQALAREELEKGEAIGDKLEDTEQPEGGGEDSAGTGSEDLEAGGEEPAAENEEQPTSTLRDSQSRGSCSSSNINYSSSSSNRMVAILL